MIRLLTENAGWKLLSLLLAIGFWFAFVGDPQLVTSISVPIQFKSIPADLEISSELPDRVHVEIKGPSAKLHNLNQQNTAVVLDLHSVSRPGERTFTLDQHNINLPSGVSLVRAIPAQLRLRFERRLTREIPVQARFSSPPPEGYRIVNEQIQPQKLRVLGPESRVNQVGFAETDPVDLAGVVGEKEFRVHAFVGDPQVRFEVPPVVVVKVSMERMLPK